MKYSLKLAETGGLPILYVSLVISFCGSVAPGIINMAAMQVSIHRGWPSGLAFSMGAVSIEMIVVLAMLYGSQSFRVPPQWVNVVKNLNLALLLVLAFGCFKAAFYPSSNGQALAWMNVKVPALFLGIGLRIAVPTMIPFWMGWISTFRMQRVLASRNQYSEYVAGLALGTLFAHSLYILFSSSMTSTMELSHFWINILLGSVFALLSVRTFLK